MNINKNIKNEISVRLMMMGLYWLAKSLAWWISPGLAATTWSPACGRVGGWK